MEHRFQWQRWLPNLAPRAWWLLVVSGIFTLSVALSNTFVNVYLWKVDRSYGAIGWYNLCVYTAMPVTFVGAGWLARSVLDLVWTMRIGIGLHALFYATALLGGIPVAQHPWVLGAIMGMAGGFYWLSFNLLSLHATERGARDRFFGLNGVVGAIAGMAAPPAAGFLIAYEDRFGGLSGYHLIFALSLGLFLLAALCSAKIKRRPVRAEQDCGQRKSAADKPAPVRTATSGLEPAHPLDLATAWRALRDRRWRLALTGIGLYGMREGVFLFLIGLLLYVSIGSELRLGEFALLQGALSFGTYLGVSRYIRPDNRLRILQIGAAAMAGAAMLFLLPVETRTIVIYGSLVALVLPLFLVPLQGIVFDEISRQCPSGRHHMEHLIVRELFGNAGRVAGIGAFLWLSRYGASAVEVSRFAAGLGFVQLGTWLMLKAAIGMPPLRRRWPGFDARAELPARRRKGLSARRNG